MRMRVLVLLGSPRRGGNSEVLAEAVVRGIEAAGGKAEVIRLSELTIEPCQNCGGCDQTGACILGPDDMTELFDKVWTAERVVLASPIYFYGVTAQTKTFIDRTQALWHRKQLLQKSGLWPTGQDRKGFFISVAATKGKRVFEGAILTVKYGFDAMGLHYGGELLVRGVEHQGDMAKNTEALRQAEELGRRIAS